MRRREDGRIQARKVNFLGHLIGLSDAQTAGESSFLGMSVRVFPEGIII